MADPRSGKGAHNVPGVPAKSILSYGKTDPGLERPTNEDAFCALDELGLYAVADGVGGRPKGEVASRLAIGQVVASVQQRSKDRRKSEASPGEVLHDAVQEANRQLLAQGQGALGSQGMATTLTVLLSTARAMHIAHVGDCRAYRWRAEEPLLRLTHDHTAVQTLVDEKLLSEEQAAQHPWRHQITRALGLDRYVEVDLSSERRLPGDRFLLCSDGLTRVVDDKEIREALKSGSSPEVQAESLLAKTLERGAPDNVTVVVVWCP